MGVKGGDRVSVLMENCHQYLELYFAAAKGNFIINPINFRLKSSEIDYIVGNSEPETIVFTPDYRHIIKSIESQKKIKNFIVVGEGIENEYEYENLIGENPRDDPSVMCRGEDALCLMYTSGTTGFPKGALLTNRNWVANSYNIASDFGVVHSDVCLFALPLYHAGVGIPLIYVVEGCKNVLLPRFDPELVLSTIKEEGVTFTFLVSTMLIAVLDFPNLNKYNTKSIHTIGCGAAPLPVEPLKKAIKVFGNVFFHTYGQTEGTCISSFMYGKKEYKLNGTEKDLKKLGSIGKGAKGIQIRVVNDKGGDVSPNEIGEIIVKGDIVMKEYWRMPEETAKTIRDGWLYSGDLATVDEDGWIYIVDRSKDMIISGGENIYPKEIENVLYSHPGVLEAAVIGIPDEKWGESVKAIVVLKRGATASEEELIEFCKQNLASYKKPKSVEFVSELPKTASGKIQKAKIRENYWAGYEKRVH
jgi:acyl-CoA synthetase (AMP-forming)/AMP-acid ligase II